MSHISYKLAAEVRRCFRADRGMTVDKDVDITEQRDNESIVDQRRLDSEDAAEVENSLNQEGHLMEEDPIPLNPQEASFIQCLCTTDLCQYATIVKSCLAETEIRMMEVAFSRKKLLYGLQQITDMWNISQRTICCNCGKFVINRCCDGETVQWVSADSVHQLKQIWNSAAESVKNIWEAVQVGRRVDSPGCHGRLKKLLLDEKAPALHFLLSSDGVQVSGTSDKVWPVMMSLLNIYRKERLLKKYVAVIGIITGVCDPSSAVFSAIINLIEAEMKRFHSVTSVYAHISAVGADKPAIAKLYNFAHHSSSYSCSYCTSEDTRVKINQGESRRDKRHGKITLDDATQCIMGFKGPSRANYVLPIYEVSLDVFHHLSEGIHKEIVTGLLSSSRNMWSLEDKMEDELLQTRLPFGWKSWNGGKLNQGTVITNVFLFGSTKLALGGVQFENPEVRLIIIAHVFTYLAASFPAELESDQLKNDCSLLLKAAGELYYKLSGRFTPKWHEITFHLVEAINNQGPLLDHSTSLTESVLCYLKADLSKHHTREKSKGLLRRWLNQSALFAELEHRSNNGDTLAAEFLHSQKRFRMQNCAADEVPLSNIAPDIRSVVLRDFPGQRYFLSLKTSKFFIKSSDCQVSYDNSCFTFCSKGLTSFGIVRLVIGDINPVVIFERIDIVDMKLLFPNCSVMNVIAKYDFIRFGKATKRLASISAKFIQRVALFIPFSKSCSTGTLFRCDAIVPHE